MKRILLTTIALAGLWASREVSAEISTNEKAFLNPPQVIKASASNYQTREMRKIEMVSSLAVTPKGRLWAIWYAGKSPKEDSNNYAVVATSGDDGKTWQERFMVDPDGEGPVRAFDPEAWLDPQGRLWLFWAQAQGHDGSVSGVWSMMTENPDLPDPEWSKPRRLTDGIMMCKPLVLSSGRWLLPVSTWRKTDNSAKVVASDDQGKTFAVLGACNVPKAVRNYDEHMVVERKDSSLWMLVRTKYGIGETVSKDGGRTWSELKPSSILHTPSRFFIRRLNSGNLLLVKHGPLEKKTGRSHLMAFVSKDDGETWGGGLLLDERKGISYPDGCQTADGTIYITYDYSRTGQKAILMAVFTEQDALAGSAVSGKVRLRSSINQTPGTHP